MRIILILPLVLTFAGGFSAPAQSNGVSGDSDYGKVAGFIADRNIFDPNRYPHDQRSSVYRPKKKISRNGPQGVILVGTMAYEKGYFAFFNAGDSDLKKVVAAGGDITDYTVKNISATAVTLIGKDKKEYVMHIGDVMYQEGGAWKINSDADSASANSPAGEPAATTTTETDNSTPAQDATTVAPSPSLESNDILKRLMEKRAKENQ
ncbi:MAG TPA: hypothetical protein VK742_17785 [Candidatus Sulfotelmatobacter sp.]|nr:hypothetical protein [Candidatus Sulfotelmatobacter sp.]